MTGIEIALGIILLVLGLALVVVVMLQSDKDTKLSGTLTGSADTFFGKSKSGTRDKMLSTATIVLSVVFTIVTVILYMIA